MSNAPKGIAPIAIGVFVLLCVGAGVWLQQRGGLDGSGNAVQEIGAIEDLQLIDADRASASATPPVKEEVGAADKKPKEEFVPAYKRPVPERVREAKRNRVYGRPAHRFESSRLQAVGLDRAEIEAIHKKFEAFLLVIRDGVPDEQINRALHESLEDRKAFREMRKQHLSDWEFDAALYATRQSNRAYFPGPIASYKPAGRVGLKPSDELLSINGIRVFDIADFVDARDSLIEGQMHQLVVARAGELFDVTLLCCVPGWGGVEMRLSKPIDLEAQAE